MKEFIFEIENSLSKQECEDIINIFEKNKEKQYQGVIGSYSSTSIDKDTKLTIDMSIKDVEDFESIKILLIHKVKDGINKYIYNIDPSFNIFFFDKIFCSITYESFLIHKYIKNEGYFKYHNDFNIEKICENKYKYRILNYLFYLNDVDEGGETEFFGNTTVKPKCGKLLFFPSEWFFPHKGNIPISNDKYVIAGWIYVIL
jgi:hypothetical protein